MKLLFENWRGYLNENVIETQAQYVLNTANAFLNELDSGHIDAIYLIGSQASRLPCSYPIARVYCYPLS